MTRTWKSIAMRSVAVGVVAGLLLAAAPAGRFSVDEELVHDRRTGLTWQRESDAKTLSYEAAEAFCLSSATAHRRGWRLPTIAELQTLVDVRENDPALDKTVFPERKGETNIRFWSSTSVVSKDSASDLKMWVLGFSQGKSDKISRKDGTARVRCVVR